MMPVQHMQEKNKIQTIALVFSIFIASAGWIWGAARISSAIESIQQGDIKRDLILDSVVTRLQQITIDVAVLKAR